MSPRRPLVVVHTAERRERSKRRVFARAGQAAALLVLAFVVLRIVAPWLVDLHDTTALVFAALLVIGLVFLVAWFAWGLVLSVIRRSRNHG